MNTYDLPLQNFRTGNISKSISVTTLSFFLWTFFAAPLANAIEADNLKQQQKEAQLDAMYETSPEATLAYRLQKLKDKVTHEIPEQQSQQSFWDKTRQALGAKPISTGQLDEISAIEVSIVQAEQEGMKGFDADEERLLGHSKLSPELKQLVLQRHQEAKQQVQQRFVALKQKLHALKQANDADAQQQAFDDLKDFLSKQQFQKGHTAVDPEHLPFGTPKREERTPLESETALYMLTHDPVLVASTVLTPEILGPKFTQRGGTEADLAETIDTVQTQAIKDLAIQLHNDPIEIYTWVANNIRFVPSYGSIQGADMTLQTKRGNAMDTASLLIALLRAAHIPARYAYGTVQMPVDKAMNWVGGVTVPAAAANLMQQGGIPTTLATTNGVITHIKFEHTWVEAFVDYEPSRGTKNIEGDNWVPMDASYKQYVFEEMVQPVNPEIKTTLSAVKELVIRPLASGLPYQLVVKKQIMSELPDGLHWKYKLSVQTADGDTVTSWSTTLTEMAGKTLGLAFTAADSVSEEMIDVNKDNPRGIPGYLVNVKAEIVKDSQIVQSGGIFKLGDDISVGQQLYIPGRGWAHASFSQTTAGEYHGIVIDTGVETTDSMNTYYDPVNKLKSSVDQYINNGVNDGYINKYTFGSAWYSSIIKNYFVANAIYDPQQAISMGVVAYRLPSYGIFKSTLDTEYYFGVPRYVRFSGFTTDIDLSQFQAIAKDNNSETAKNFILSTGFRYSFMEGEIPEKMLSGIDENANGVSAVELLGMAKDHGQDILEINASNLSLLNTITAPISVLSEMRNALYAGMELTAHPAPVQVNGTPMMGYLIIDPVTGSGAYKIANGINGGLIQTGGEHSIYYEWSASDGESAEEFLKSNPEAATHLVQSFFDAFNIIIEALTIVTRPGTVVLAWGACKATLNSQGVLPTARFVLHYFCGDGETVLLDEWGLGYNVINSRWTQLAISDALLNGSGLPNYKADFTLEPGLFSLGRTTLHYSGNCSDTTCQMHFSIRDWFRDPVDIGEDIAQYANIKKVYVEFPFGTRYEIHYDVDLVRSR